MRFGVYYSGGLDWTFEPHPIVGMADGLAAVPLDPAYERYCDAHYRELVARYQPSVLWNDISYPPHGGALWKLMADYYDAVPEGVVNDRFLPAPAWLARAYRAWRGEGMAETARRRRVERATLALREGAEPLAEIAVACGFADQSHMNRAFRAVLGRTPLEVRREAPLLAGLV